MDERRTAKHQQQNLRVLQQLRRFGNAQAWPVFLGSVGPVFYADGAKHIKSMAKLGEECQIVPKKIPPNQTPAEIVEKVLYLRRKYHLGRDAGMRLVFGR